MNAHIPGRCKCFLSYNCQNHYSNQTSNIYLVWADAKTGIYSVFANAYPNSINLKIFY